MQWVFLISVGYEALKGKRKVMVPPVKAKRKTFQRHSFTLYFLSLAAQKVGGKFVLFFIRLC